ncbi:vitamin B12 ABC transporter substrate-binding protein BtuF [Enterobacteriaceae bacterium LUAb1]
MLLFLLAAPVGISATRIVTLAPHLTELAFAAGITPVGVSDYSDYPQQATSLPSVASWQGINIERILALKPDIVLAWRGGNPRRQTEQLQKLGLHVIWLDISTLSSLSDALRLLAAYSPQPDYAVRQAAMLEQRFARLKKQYYRKKPLPVFLQFGTRPLFTASANTLQNQILDICGGENIFANSRVPWPQVSREQVLARQPQAIVVSGKKAYDTVQHFWQPQLSVPVIVLNDNWFNRPGPRILLAAQQLCQQLAASAHLSGRQIYHKE